MKTFKPGDRVVYVPNAESASYKTNYDPTEWWKDVPADTIYTVIDMERYSKEIEDRDGLIVRLKRPGGGYSSTFSVDLLELYYDPFIKAVRLANNIPTP